MRVDGNDTPFQPRSGNDSRFCLIGASAAGRRAIVAATKKRRALMKAGEAAKAAVAAPATSVRKRKPQESRGTVDTMVTAVACCADTRSKGSPRLEPVPCAGSLMPVNYGDSNRSES